MFSNVPLFSPVNACRVSLVRLGNITIENHNNILLLPPVMVRKWARRLLLIADP